MKLLLVGLLALMAVTPGCYSGQLRIPKAPSVAFDKDHQLLMACMSVVQLEAEMCFGTEMRTIRGSAVLIGPRLAVTARHCVINATEVRLRKGSHVVAAVAKRFSLKPDADFAEVDLETEFPNAVPATEISIKALPQAYEACFAIGYALGIPSATVTEGLIQPRWGEFLRFSSPIIFGNSGGGVFCIRNGELVLCAVSTAGFTAGSGIVPHMAIGYEIHIGRGLLRGIP